MNKFSDLYNQILKENGLIFEEEQSSKKLSFKDVAKKFQDSFPVEKIVSLCTLPSNAAVNFPEDLQAITYDYKEIGNRWNNDSDIDTDEERNAFKLFLSQNKGTDNPLHPLFFKKVLFFIRERYKIIKNNPNQIKGAASKDAKFFDSFIDQIMLKTNFLFDLFSDKNQSEGLAKVNEIIQFLDKLITEINNLLDQYKDDVIKLSKDKHKIAEKFSKETIQFEFDECYRKQDVYKKQSKELSDEDKKKLADAEALIKKHKTESQETK